MVAVHCHNHIKPTTHIHRRQKEISAVERQGLFDYSSISFYKLGEPSNY